MVKYLMNNWWPKVLSLLIASHLSHSSANILTERYNLSYINLDNGLPHNNISWLFTDSNGFLWIATYGGGLVRYDGFNMMTPALGLKSLSCKSVTEDRFKRLWVAFDEGTNVIDLSTMLPIVAHHHKIREPDYLCRRRQDKSHSHLPLYRQHTRNQRARYRR